MLHYTHQNLARVHSFLFLALQGRRSDLESNRTDFRKVFFVAAERSDFSHVRFVFDRAKPESPSLGQPFPLPLPTPFRVGNGNAWANFVVGVMLSVGAFPRLARPPAPRINQHAPGGASAVTFAAKNLALRARASKEAGFRFLLPTS